MKTVNQMVSLVDYLCSPDAPPERRRQFQQLWQAVQNRSGLEAACQAAFGHGLAQLESDWKAWLATATFGPPVPPPPEVAEAAQNEVIPLARNVEAPLQDRIKAICALGGSGWSIGEEPLVELLIDPQSDLRREAHRALQMLLGRVDVCAALSHDKPIPGRTRTPGIFIGKNG